MVRRAVLGLMAICAVRCAAAQDAAGDLLLRDADQRIESLRKADARIVVLDAKGKPAPDVRVRIEQTRHAFLFGCAAISLAKHADASQEQAYRKLFGGLFNYATVLTYWQNTDPEPNRQDFALLDAQVNALKEMGITVKGHPLILAGAAPKWAPADPDDARRLTEVRIRALPKKYEGLIEFWDVVGDATLAAGAATGLGAWARKAGPAQLTADAFTWARESNPKAALVYNEYKLDGDLTKLIQDVDRLKGPVDVLGLEAHMTEGNWPLSKLWATAESYSTLKKPLHFSEITVLSDDPAGDHAKTWPSTPEGEQRQADYAERMYTLLFSHPSVQGIAWWNFVDGDWDRIPGGLIRADMTPKPIYDRLRKLIHEKWWTRTERKTDKAGEAAFRGFAGRYQVTVLSRSGNLTRQMDVSVGKQNRIVVRAP